MELSGQSQRWQGQAHFAGCQAPRSPKWATTSCRDVAIWAIDLKTNAVGNQPQTLVRSPSWAAPGIQDETKPAEAIPGDHTHSYFCLAAVCRFCQDYPA